MAWLSSLTETGVDGTSADRAAPRAAASARPKPRSKTADADQKPASAASPTPASAAQQRLAEVISQHQEAVVAYLRARVVPVEEADDLAQEVFLRFYVARARFDQSRMIRPYLLGIARNVLREWTRRQRTRREVRWTDVCLEAEVHLTDDASQYEEELRHLPACLKQLRAPARQAVEMHYRQQARLQEIGQALRRSVGAVKLLLFRARQALRRCLDRKRGEASHD
jgi:RNA polymerase sigma-70 factor (ECF subfamily)